MQRVSLLCPEEKPVGPGEGGPRRTDTLGRQEGGEARSRRRGPVRAPEGPRATVWRGAQRPPVAPLSALRGPVARPAQTRPGPVAAARQAVASPVAPVPVRRRLAVARRPACAANAPLDVAVALRQVLQGPPEDATRPSAPASVPSPPLPLSPPRPGPDLRPGSDSASASVAAASRPRPGPPPVSASALSLSYSHGPAPAPPRPPPPPLPLSVAAPPRSHPGPVPASASLAAPPRSRPSPAPVPSPLLPLSVTVPPWPRLRLSQPRSPSRSRLALLRHRPRL